MTALEKSPILYEVGRAGIAGYEDKDESLTDAVYVQDRYSRLNAEHIEQVLDGIRENTSKVMHTKAYLMKCLFNAPETLESKVMMDVNHDLYGERRRE